MVTSGTAHVENPLRQRVPQTSKQVSYLLRKTVYKFSYLYCCVGDDYVYICKVGSIFASSL